MKGSPREMMAISALGHPPRHNNGQHVAKTLTMPKIKRGSSATCGGGSRLGVGAVRVQRLRLGFVVFSAVSGGVSRLTVGFFGGQGLRLGFLE
jgi:hypothetical protein